MFRNQIPDSYVPVLVDKVADFLNSTSPVNNSYASACIEKLLIRKTSDGTNNHIFNPQTMDPVLVTKLLQNLCVVLSETKNLYAMRGLFRVVQLAQNHIQPFAQTLGQVLSQFISQAAKDEAQSSPNYVYILFETTALTLRFLKHDNQAFEQVEASLTPSLNMIIQQNITDMNGYAFQIYSLFVANADTLKDNYTALSTSILTNISNWDKSMKYLIPALSQFLIAMTFKHPATIIQYTNNIQEIVTNLLSSELRMESVALQLATAVFEKLGTVNAEFLDKCLRSIFTCLHFYRNSTKTKVIPISITKAMHSCFSTFMINHGTQALIAACNAIQPNILFMVLKSEGDKIKHVTSPPRDKRYTIIGYSQLIVETLNTIPQDTLPTLISALVELCGSDKGSGF